MVKRLPWVEKYRPKKLEDIITHTSVIDTIDNLIQKGQLPHLMFTGPPGTGKTTTAQVIALTLYGQQNLRKMILELNASDDRGIDVVRDSIKRFASTRALWTPGQHKLIILDEADAMTHAAQAALRRVIEKFSANVRFVVICNYPERLIPAIRSRCTEFRFPPLKPDSALARLRFIAEQEKVQFDEGGLQALLRLGGGDMRRSINLLQSTHFSVGQVHEVSVYQTSGFPLPGEMQRLLEELMSVPLPLAAERLESLRVGQGLALLEIVRELHRQTVLIDFDSKILGRLLISLAEVEQRVSEGANEHLQCLAVAAAFQIARQELSGVYW